jgi:adenylylsulfate kinase-like enzyme
LLTFVVRLLYHQILTEHFFGVFDNIIDRKCEAHAAFGIFRRTDKGTFTTSTSVDLGFDDPKWPSFSAAARASDALKMATHSLIGAPMD